MNMITSDNIKVYKKCPKQFKESLIPEFPIPERFKLKVNKIKLVKVFINFNSGRAECRVLHISGPGTLDVERIDNGRCFRVTGLAIKYGDLKNDK